MMNSAQILHWILNKIPKKTPQHLSKLLTPLAYRIHEKGSHSGEIHQTIALAFKLPINDPKVDQIVYNSIKHLLQTILEVIRFDHLGRDWSKKISVQGMEYFQQAHRKGKGVILFSAHVGNWELLISGIPLLGVDQPHAIVWKQPANQWNDLLDQQRQLWGTKLLWTQELKRKEIEEILARGGTILIFNDRFEQGKTQVKLFGQPIGTPAGPVLFARKYGAQLLPIHTYRDQEKHKIIIDPPLQLGSLPENKDLTPDLQRCMSMIEGWICQHPAQWIWFLKQGEWTK